MNFLTHPMLLPALVAGALSVGALSSAQAAAAPAAVPPPPPVIPAPPQDQGLPYTRSAHPRALALIQSGIAVFPGSRYAYVHGLRVRLDDAHWHDEAVLQDGVVYVPRAFAAVLAMKEFQADAPPAYLADRWVSAPHRPGVPKLHGVHAITVDGRPYVDLAGAAKSLGMTAYAHPRGFVLIGSPPPTLDGVAAPLLDSVVTLFDTPEKFADPDIATRYVPTLAIQGKWTDHVKVTPEQRALLHGPETQWPTAPKSEYDYAGFNKTLLGSQVPPPGVYPRVLFSPEDVPHVAARIKSTKMGQKSLMEMQYLFQKSWWDPKTSDGQLLQKLASGDTAGLHWDTPAGMAPDAPVPPNGIPATFQEDKQGIFNTHISYVTECLTDMAFYCLLTGDDARGRQAAAALVNFYKMREPLIDATNAMSDSEFGSSYTAPDGTVTPMDANGAATHWRTMGVLTPHMNIGLSLDFGGKWMTEDEKQAMYRIIAKVTYGRRAYGQDGPVRFRDVNWVGWDLTNFVAVTAIEGQPGFDREVYDSSVETVRAFADWGIDDSGVIYESNGKTPGSLEFLTLSMVALARRGENVFGHPHWRKLLTGQIEMTSPSGNVVVNSGTQYDPFSREHLSLQLVDNLKAFFPQDRRPDYLLSRAGGVGLKSEYLRGWDITSFDPAAYAAELPNVTRLRLPSPTYPGFAKSVLYDADWQPTTREDLNLPLDFDAPVHGVFSSYSDRTPDAAWINMMVRPDHYLGAGHHHADAGMVHFSSGGVDWFTQTQFDQNYDGKYYNLVLVDGHSEPENMPGIANGYQGAATYLGARTAADGGFASADLTYSYTWRWLTQPPAAWPDSAKTMGWEMDPTPYIAKMFAGTARYKMRPWWANYNYSNYIATSRAPFNPMQYVYRTAGLIRGAHPYGVVVDDLKKDDGAHLYQWAAMLNGGVWQAQMAGLPAGQAVLAYRHDADADSGPATGAAKPLIVPQAGESLLLVCPLGAQPDAADRPTTQVTTEPGPAVRQTAVTFYNRLVINQQSVEAHYKVLLIPFHAGDPLPTVTYDAAGGKATVAWPDGQQDELQFTAGPDGRSKVAVSRAGKTLIESR